MRRREREKYKIKSGKLSANLFFIFTKCLYENDWVFGKWVEKVFLKKISNCASCSAHNAKEAIKRRLMDWFFLFLFSNFFIRKIQWDFAFFFKKYPISVCKYGNFHMCKHSRGHFLVMRDFHEYIKIEKISRTKGF